MFMSAVAAPLDTSQLWVPPNPERKQLLNFQSTTPDRSQCIHLSSEDSCFPRFSSVP